MELNQAERAANGAARASKESSEMGGPQGLEGAKTGLMLQREPIIVLHETWPMSLLAGQKTKALRTDGRTFGTTDTPSKKKRWLPFTG